jgi:citrate synthase
VIGVYSKGLKGIVAVETALSHIDGIKGELLYRGRPVEEISITKSFEEMAYFLWYGTFPNEVQLTQFKQEMGHYRKLPDYMMKIIENIPKEMNMMDVLRTAVSSLILNDKSEIPTVRQAMQITAIMPSIIAYRYRQINNLDIIYPNKKLSHVENYLYMLKGKLPSKEHAEALESYMILTMEHGLNASTFAGRVTVSSESDIISGIVSAIGTMKGSLHGGAPSGVIQLLSEVSDNTKVEDILKTKLESGERIFGFGHRIYKTKDPRAIALKTKLLQINPNDPWLQLALQVEEKAIKLLDQYKPGRNLRTNVEFYAAAIMKAIHLEEELFTPTFSAARSVGWSAHIMEQMIDNTIFRPESKYIGARTK